jgi:hypothetical protein
MILFDFILYLNEFKELKYLNGLQFSFQRFIHLSCENFQTKSIVSKKSYLKRFSSLNLHSKRVYKS